jgi:hypothetical protein
MTMIERLAAKLHELTLRNGGVSRGANDMMDDVKALLIEMGEPTPSMLHRGGEADAEGSEDNARDVWQAMISEALGEPDEG